MRGGSGAALFRSDFLDWLVERGDLARLRIRAAPDGRVVHPHTPITVVEGPLALGQLLETMLLNHRNFATLVATKAARIKQAARSGVGSGVRNASRSRNRRQPRHRGGAGGRRRFFFQRGGRRTGPGFPPGGTHAHSLVQAFMASGGDELDAFRAFARVYPDDCVLLVDTVNTLESGLPNAVTVFEELRRRGHRPVGIRLDSGDPASLALQAARILDRAGFEDAAIVLSDRLDELAIDPNHRNPRPPRRRPRPTHRTAGIRSGNPAGDLRRFTEPRRGSYKLGGDPPERRLEAGLQTHRRSRQERATRSKRALASLRVGRNGPRGPGDTGR